MSPLISDPGDDGTTRIEYKATPGGVLQRRNGDARQGVTIVHEGPAVYASADADDLTPYAGALTTNIDGEVPGWLGPGIYCSTDPTNGKSVTFEVGGVTSADAVAELLERAAVLERGRVPPPTGDPDIDTAAIQATIDAQPAEFATVTLDFGVYMVNHSIDLVGRSNLTIRGQGRDLTTVACTADLDGSGGDQNSFNDVFNAINFVEVGSYMSNLAFEDFTIDCSLQSATGVPPGTTFGRNLCAIECQNVDDVRFSRLRIVRAFGNALVSASIDPGVEAAVTGALTEDCIFDECVRGTLPQYDDITGSVIQYGAMIGGEIRGCDFNQSGGPAVDIFNCHGTRVHHNTLRGVGDTPIGTDQTVNSIHSDFGLVNCTIDHNVLSDAGCILLSGIMLPVFFNDNEPTPGPLGCTIDHNVITGTGSTPFTALAVPASGGSVTNTTNTPMLIAVSGGSDIVVTIDGDAQVGSGQDDDQYLAPAGAPVAIAYTTPPTWTWRRAPNALYPHISVLAGNVAEQPLGVVDSTSIAKNTSIRAPSGGIQLYDGRSCNLADNIVADPAEWLAGYPVVQLLGAKDEAGLALVPGTGTMTCNVSNTVITDTRAEIKIGAAFQTDDLSLDNGYTSNRFPAGAVGLQGDVPRERVIWEDNYSGAALLGLPLPTFDAPLSGLLTLPCYGGTNAWVITGDVPAGITDIVSTMTPDAEVTLLFTEPVVVKTKVGPVGNLTLPGGDFAADAGYSLTLVRYDDDGWVEKARSPA
jgi:hypothetical protein